MFGDLMSNMQQQQDVLQKKLKNLAIEVVFEGVRIKGNAGREVTDITISDSLFEVGSQEVLEDILLEAFNRFIIKSSELEGNETQNAMKDLLPPGLGHLFGS